MGTRSIIRFILLAKKKLCKLVALYGQYDGFLDSKGKELADFLLTVVDEYGRASRPLGEWAAEFIALRKKNAGNDYFYHARLAMDQEYTYDVVVDQETRQVGVDVRCRETNGESLMCSVANFHTWCTQHANKRKYKDEHMDIAVPDRLGPLPEHVLPLPRVSNDVDPGDYLQGALVRFRLKKRTEPNDEPTKPKYLPLGVVYHTDNGGFQGVGSCVAHFLNGFLSFNTMELPSCGALTGKLKRYSYWIENKAINSTGKVANGLDCLVAQYIACHKGTTVVMSSHRQAPFVYTVNLDERMDDVFVSFAVNNQLHRANLTRSEFSYLMRHHGTVSQFPQRMSRRLAKQVPERQLELQRSDSDSDNENTEEMGVYCQKEQAAVRRKYRDIMSNLAQKRIKHA